MLSLKLALPLMRAAYTRQHNPSSTGLNRDTLGESPTVTPSETSQGVQTNVFVGIESENPLVWIKCRSSSGLGC